MSEMKRTLVTGGAGFIGSHLTEKLVSRGCNVTVVDDFSKGDITNLDNVRKNISINKIDIRTAAFLDFLEMEQFDVLFHMAGNAYVPPSVRDPMYDLELNMLAPFRILEYLRIRNSGTVFIYPSSAAVYGNPIRNPMREYDPTVPISPYGVSKLATERYIEVFAGLYGTRAASMRLFSVYGPRQKKQIIYDFMVKMDEDPEKLEIFGDGKQTRDLVYVKDVVNAAIAIWEHGELRGEVYNIATGCEFTTTEIAMKMSAVMNCEPELIYTGNLRGGDAEKWRGDIGRLTGLGFNPAFTFEDGLKRTVEWFASRQKSEVLAGTDPSFH